MKTGRRQFVLRTSAALAGLSAAGCRPEALLGLARPRHAAMPFRGPTAPTIDLVQHVLNRGTFGVRPSDREAVLALAGTPGEAAALWLERQLDPQSIPDTEADRLVREIGLVLEPTGELFEYKKPVLLAALVRSTLLRAVWSKRQLQEVMVEFWSDHFNIDVSKGDCAWLKAADDRDVVRPHALGKFRELLRASALSPAMLWYLDGRLNRRRAVDEKPNENYARELLELHTLGVHGGYTQRDVMEVARCLTGWAVRPRSGFGKGRVEFHPEAHDDGEKTVLGRRIPAGEGERDLEHVLDAVAGHPATARHVAFKLCRRFIADSPPARAVEDVAASFEKSRGDVGRTLRTLFARPEFKAEGQESEWAGLRGNRLKRPFHFVVSVLRATDAETDGGEALATHLAAMGQAPFQYPTPDGYPEEAAAWTATLLSRWRFAAALVEGRLQGTRVDTAGLRRRAGGDDAVIAHLLGRRPAGAERAAWATAGGGATGLAVLLASPAFQRF